MRRAREPFVYVSLETFERLAAENDVMRLERGPDGRLIALPPTGRKTGSRNVELVRQLANWNAGRPGLGSPGESQTGFLLPDTAVRAPDASWISNARLASADDTGEGFGHAVPEFAVELLSPSDSLRAVREKAREYIANGARLVWILDPFRRNVEVYRPGEGVVKTHDPASLSADPELPGFVLDVGRVFDPP